MVTVATDPAFHLRGRHVQHAHGRNSTEGGEHLSGAMIALMPTEADAKRLRIGGGEKAEQLHLTLYFLGEGSDWSEEERTGLVNALIDRVAENPTDVIEARAFGVSHWNGDGDNPCWVLNVTKTPQEDPPEFADIEGVRTIAADALLQTELFKKMPEQYSPWVPHVCLAYTDDLSLTAELQKRLGTITFDRIRVAFAGDYTDILLNEDSLTAAANPLFRRNLNDYELRSNTDFIRMQETWTDAVDAAWAAIQPIREEQLSSLTEQVFNAAQTDDLDALTSLSLEDGSIQAVLFEHMTRAANEAGMAQQIEAEEQGVTVPDWSLEENLTAAIGLSLLQSISEVTAKVINTSFIQSAIRRALSLIGRPQISPEEIREEVEAHLEALSEAGPRESIGGAITAAQNEGRRTVLAAAPEASQYVASEILDRNVCQPCRQVDGTTYETLADATEQYPSGGFRNCLGGVRCRGTIVAVWDEE
jgi:2'-5' RNA ligase